MFFHRLWIASTPAPKSKNPVPKSMKAVGNGKARSRGKQKKKRKGWRGMGKGGTAMHRMGVTWRCGQDVVKSVRRLLVGYK